MLSNTFLIIFALIYPILFLITRNMGVKRVFNSNKVLQNAVVEFKFYEDHFEETNPSGTSNITYDKLNEIIETKTNFYLMIAKNQGYIVIKQNAPEGLIELIQSKKK